MILIQSILALIWKLTLRAKFTRHLKKYWKMYDLNDTPNSSSQEAVQRLYREIGVVETVRFLRQFTTGYGNYTEEREALFAGKSVEDLIAEIKQRRQAT